MTLQDLLTPCLLLDQRRVHRNIERMHAHLRGRGTRLRPHLKTSKCLELARLLTEGQHRGIMVSSLREAQYFGLRGFPDVMYSVAVPPGKAPHLVKLLRDGINLSVLSDNREAIAALKALGSREKLRVPPNERATLVAVAKLLQQHGLECATASVGSTPAALSSGDLSGVTEVRAGVFVFNDLMMVNLGICRIEDLALSVLTSVIGHRRDPSRVVTDSGWMSLSGDLGTRGGTIDYAYGLVADGMTGEVFPNLSVLDTNQEHGLIGSRDGEPLDLTRFPVGRLLRILPVHACATAACHGHYHVTDGPERLTCVWNRLKADWAHRCRRKWRSNTSA